VGITSYHATKPRTRGQVKKDAKALGNDLAKIEGVTNLSVRVGRGGWEGGGEPTMIVKLTAKTDQARRGVQTTLAKYGQKWGQDGVLLRRKSSASNPNAQPSVSMAFDQAPTRKQKAAIQATLVEKVKEQYNGDANVGWTWGRQGNKTTLESQCVNQWGGDPAKHTKALAETQSALKAKGTKFKASTSYNEVATLDSDDYGTPNSYQKVIDGKDPFTD
jgi:hypothetical protein